MKRWLFCIGLVLGFAPPARAWTRAQVREAVVELALRPDGRVQVALELRVEVRGGQLERLELTGLEDSLVLDAAEPGWFENQDGLRGTPSISVQGGELEMRFAREGALRQGLHRVGVRYDAPARASLGPTGEKTLLSWTLPGWEAGLDRAQVTWVLPLGAELVAAGEVAQTVAVEQRDGAQVLRLSRVQVPRGSPWSVSVQIPTRVRSARGPDATAGQSAAPGQGAAETRFAWVALLVLTLGWGAREHVRRQARELGLSVRAPWGMPRLALSAAAALAGLSVALSASSLTGALLALVAVGLACAEKVQPACEPLGLGHFEPIRKAELVRLRQRAGRELLGGAFWADAGTISGLCGALACAGAALWYGGALGGPVHPWALALACGLVPWLTSARWRRPRSVAERVRRLLRAASALRLDGCGARLIWFISRTGACSEPRLRIATATRYHGLLRIEIMADSRRGTAPLLLCVVATCDSGVDRALTEGWGAALRELSRGGKRVAFLRPVDDLDDDLAELLRALSQHAQRSVHAMLEEARRAA